MIQLKNIKRKIELTDDKIEVDPTENKYDFTGRGRGVLNIVRDLQKISPCWRRCGLFFLSNKSAFKYKAIDELIKQEQRQKYFIQVH